jgi:hypothetical protein
LNAGQPPIFPEAPVDNRNKQKGTAATHPWMLAMERNNQDLPGSEHVGGGINGPGPRQEFPEFHQQQQHRPYHKGPRHDFPKYDGTATSAWIKKTEKYFKLCHVPEEEKVEVATLYFTAKADTWLENIEFDIEEVSWHKFCKKLKKRFAEDSTYDVVKVFHGLKQVSTVDNYIDTFECIVGNVRRENPEIPESYYIKSFVAGLQDYEQHHTQIQKPSSLIDAYWIARRLEASNPFKRGAITSWGQKQSYQKTTVPNKETLTTHAKPTAQVTPAKPQLENVPIKSDKCFRCGEKWVPGHRFHCKMNKQVRAMLSKEEED